MGKRYQVFYFILLILLAGCAQAIELSPTPTLTLAVNPIIIPIATTIPSVTPSIEIFQDTLTPTRSTDESIDWLPLEYKLVYQDENISIHEALLGPTDTWNLDWFNLVEKRIQDPVADLGFMDLITTCSSQYKSTGYCEHTIEINLSDGNTVPYTLRWNEVYGGESTLERNDQVIWNGRMRNPICSPFRASAQIGDGIAIDYYDYPEDNPGKIIIESILYTDGENVIDAVQEYGYTLAFAPVDYQGKLLFFAMKNSEYFMVYDGQEIGKRYNSIFNQYCCWDGPKIQIVSNGQVVDFFAKKDNNWYHVQAGNLQ